MSTLEELVSAWDGEAVVNHFDRPTGTWIFIALHSSALGRPTGGTRLRAYPSPAEGLRDAMRLAAGMTAKWAVLDLAMGGGKAVLAVPGPLDGDARRGLLRRYGRLVTLLNGAFATGEDLGTTPDDMGIIAEETGFVLGGGGGGDVTDPGPFTARGVWSGLRAAVREVLGRDDVRGLRVLVQGVGDVGLPLARHLAEAGAALLVADADAARAERVCRELGGEPVAPDDAYDVECDVFAPCAVGGVLSAATIPRLRCRIVAGSANNQLGEAADAERLHERGIVYAPDYVINGGGALAFGRHAAGEDDLDVLMTAVDQVGETVTELLREARTRGESPVAAAERKVAERLARAK